MSEKASKPRARRKLSRRQVQEILERNIKLYRDEESFVPYLIELALYLLEYEYDWGESGASAPAAVVQHESEEDATAAVLGAIANPKLFQVGSGGGGGSSAAPISTGSRTPAPAARTCIHCGARITDEVLCPNCKNLTK